MGNTAVVPSDANIKLLEVAIVGNVQKATLLLLAGAEINTRDPLGRTPLHFAAKYGHHDLCKELLDRGAEINALQKYNQTPLYIASKKGQIDVVKVLLECKADIEMSSNNGCTPLSISAQNGHGNCVNFLLDKGAKTNVPEKNGCTALYYASKNGFKDIVSQLLKKGANVNATDEYGYTPLCIATQEGHIDVVAVLVINLADSSLGRHIDKKNPLHIASENGFVSIVELLLKTGTIVNCITKDIFTPLHFASEKGHKDIVELLLKHQADLDILAENIYTPADVASYSGHLDIEKLLTTHMNSPLVKSKKWKVDLIRLNEMFDIVTDKIAQNEKDFWKLEEEMFQTTKKIACFNAEIENVKDLLDLCQDDKEKNDLVAKLEIITNNCNNEIERNVSLQNSADIVHMGITTLKNKKQILFLKLKK